MLCARNVIFDLDETCISRSEHKLTNTELRSFTITSSPDVFFYVRPHISEEFLDWVFEHFNVGVITLASTNYAYEVVHYLFGRRKLAFLFTRDNYMSEHLKTEFPGKKPLDYLFRKVKPLNFYPCNTIIIDDSASVASTNKYNTIHVPEWKVTNLSDKVFLTVRKVLEYFLEQAKTEPCSLHTWFSGCAHMGTPILKRFPIREEDKKELWNES